MFFPENRSSPKMRKSKLTLKGLPSENMVLSQKLSSMKEKMSVREGFSSKCFSKPFELHDDIFKLMDFDIMNNYENYFPDNNSHTIITKLKYNFNEESPKSPKSTGKKKRNLTRRNTKNKTVFIRKETIIENFERNTSLFNV